MGGAALYHCDGIPKTIAGCSNDWNKGTKWSRPWIVGRELPYYREFQGCTVAYVQKCQVTPDSLFAEINHYNWPVSQGRKRVIFQSMARELQLGAVVEEFATRTIMNIPAGDSANHIL